MTRVLYNPLNLVKGLFGGGGGGAAPAPPAAQTRATETDAREEAARRAASEAQARQGARASVLTDSGLADTFGSTSTKKKSLLGG